VPSLSHRIKLCPNWEAEQYLVQAVGTARFAWNWALARWQEKYDAGEKGMTGYSLVKEFNSIKAEEFPWTGSLSKWVPQKAIQNLGAAFRSFFAKKTRYPRFKKKGAARESFYIGLRHFGLSGKYLRLPKLQTAVKMAQEVRFPGRIKSVTISREAGEWFAAFHVELAESYAYPHRCENQTTVGVDLGLKTLAVCSDGAKVTKFESPKSYRTAERKLKRAQRDVSRKIKGSSNRTRARLRLVKLHSRVRRIRVDATHKMTSWVVRSHRWIGIEDLNVSGMVRNHCLAKSVSDAAFFEVRRQLTYKAVLSGSNVAIAARFFPSSKTCSDCGHVLEKLDLNTREWDCPSCGVVHDRDENAAENLRLVAQRYWETKNACGEDVRPENPSRIFGQSSMKQECLGSSGFWGTT
jgi:putative transposase